MGIIMPGGGNVKTKPIHRWARYTAPYSLEINTESLNSMSFNNPGSSHHYVAIYSPTISINPMNGVITFNDPQMYEFASGAITLEGLNALISTAKGCYCQFFSDTVLTNYVKDANTNVINQNPGTDYGLTGLNLVVFIDNDTYCSDTSGAIYLYYHNVVSRYVPVEDEVIIESENILDYPVNTYSSGFYYRYLGTDINSREIILRVVPTGSLDYTSSPFVLHFPYAVRYITCKCAYITNGTSVTKDIKSSSTNLNNATSEYNVLYNSGSQGTVLNTYLYNNTHYTRSQTNMVDMNKVCVDRFPGIQTANENEIYGVTNQLQDPSAITIRGVSSVQHTLFRSLDSTTLYYYDANKFANTQMTYVFVGYRW